MRSIDLVKHHSTLLPGLADALGTVLVTLNRTRNIRGMAPITIMVPGPEPVPRRLKEAARKKVLRLIERQKQADEVRARIAKREEDARLKTRNVKTLVNRRRP